jgi:hypothetical protein
VKKPARKNGSTGPTGSPVAVYTLAVLLVAGGIFYNRLYLRDAPPAGDSTSLSSHRRSALEQSGDAPPLPRMTPEEAAVFEQAAEEHYGLPPGYQLPHFVEKEAQPSNYEEVRPVLKYGAGGCAWMAWGGRVRVVGWVA